jgi:hypothetical protein
MPPTTRHAGMMKAIHHNKRSYSVGTHISCGNHAYLVFFMSFSPATMAVEFRLTCPINSVPKCFFT